MKYFLDTSVTISILYKGFESPFIILVHIWSSHFIPISQFGFSPSKVSMSFTVSISSSILFLSVFLFHVNEIVGKDLFLEVRPQFFPNHHLREEGTQQWRQPISDKSLGILHKSFGTISSEFLRLLQGDLVTRMKDEELKLKDQVIFAGVVWSQCWQKH